jgi:hypothetical protein
MLYREGQAGASANLTIPEGLNVDDLETAEDMVLDWHESGDYRAIDLVIKLYEHLAVAARGERSRSSSAFEARCSGRSPSELLTSQEVELKDRS